MLFKGKGSALGRVGIYLLWSVCFFLQAALVHCNERMYQGENGTQRACTFMFTCTQYMISLFENCKKIYTEYKFTKSSNKYVGPKFIQFLFECIFNWRYVFELIQYLFIFILVF